MFASGHGRRATLLLAGFLLAGPACRAVLFKSTGDTNYNTTAPTGSLTNSGWELQGWWLGSYLGTPIAPTYFVSAKHVGGTVGSVLGLGYGYHTTAYFDDPNSDLRVWKVAETFPVYALLYTNTDENAKHCVVYGRGTPRGSPVIVSGVTNGWQWATGDTKVRWGENDISGTANGGSLLRAAFDRNGGSNECDLSVGDSGGAMFIRDSSNVWRLAGINYGVDGPFSNATYGVINAALMDRGGLYEDNGTTFTNNVNVAQDNPSEFYSTRISTNIAWINSVIDYLPGNDLVITAVTPAGANVQISFTTGINKVYEIERRDSLSTGSWTTLTNGVVGTGGIMTITDVGAASLPKRFYRLGLMPVLP